MATTAKKGSRMNPYTPSEYRNFVENYNWNGGWMHIEPKIHWRPILEIVPKWLLYHTAFSLKCVRMAHGWEDGCPIAQVIKSM